MSNSTLNPFKQWLDTLESDAWYTVTTTMLGRLRTLVNAETNDVLVDDHDTFKVVEYLAQNKVIELERNEDKSLKIKKII